MKTWSTLAFATLLGAALPAPAVAADRAWVSSTGTDSGTCLVATPCRTFQYAHDHLDPGGEIDVKDPGGYGALTITKSIAIVADGVLATVGVPLHGTGITVLTGGNDTVTLHGLTVDGFDPNDGGIGIRVSYARTITINHCTIIGGYAGILVDSINTYAMITNSLVTHSYYGILNSKSANVLIGDNVITSNSFGIYNALDTAASYGTNSINLNFTSDVYGKLNSIGMQ